AAPRSGPPRGLWQRAPGAHTQTSTAGLSRAGGARRAPAGAICIALDLPAPGGTTMTTTLVLCETCGYDAAQPDAVRPGECLASEVEALLQVDDDLVI